MPNPLTRAFWYIHPPIAPENLRNLRGKTLGAYYNDFRTDLTNLPGPFDPDGVIMNDHKDPIGLQYNPITVCQFALGAHTMYLETGNRKYLSLFESQVEWLLKNAVIDDRMGTVWYLDFYNPYFELRPPWPSALAQGQAMSVLLRAHQLGWGERAKEYSMDAMKIFSIPSDQGGIQARHSDGSVWYEEYPTPHPSLVLGGFMHALLGLYDVLRVTDSALAARLFEQGVRSLERNIHRYDIKYWSRYDLLLQKNRPNSPFYHELYTSLAKIMALLTGSRTIWHYYHKWNQYRSNPLCKTLCLSTVAAAKLVGRASEKTAAPLS